MCHSAPPLTVGLKLANGGYFPCTSSRHFIKQMKRGTDTPNVDIVEVRGANFIYNTSEGPEYIPKRRDASLVDYRSW